MAKIRHCNGMRLAKTYWLFPSNPDQQYEILRVLKRCPKCGLKVMELLSMDYNNNYSQPVRVKQEDIPKYEHRIHTDKAYETRRDITESRALIYVSDYTRLLSRDPAAISKQLIKRQKVVSPKQKAKENAA